MENNDPLDTFKDFKPVVPEGHFEGQMEKIFKSTVYKAELKEKLLSQLNTESNLLPDLYRVPEGYFEKNIVRLENIPVLKEELLLLLEKGQNEIFSAPENYFDNVYERIRVKLPQKKRPLFDFPWETVLKKKYALAMVSMLVLLFSGIFYMKNDSNTTGLVENWEKKIAKLENGEVLEYIYENDHIEISLLKLPEKSWESELNKTEIEEKDVNNLILTDEL